MQHLMRFEPDFNRLPCYYWTWIVIHSQVVFIFTFKMKWVWPTQKLNKFNRQVKEELEALYVCLATENF